MARAYPAPAKITTPPWGARLPRYLVNCLVGSTESQNERVRDRARMGVVSWSEASLCAKWHAEGSGLLPTVAMPENPLFTFAT
jgi:hypothetical protein